MTQLKFCVVFLLTCFIGRWFAYDAASSVSFYALVTAPGTFMHELAHYVAAMLTNGNPTGLSIIPTNDSLGRVYVIPNWYNAALIGTAPLLLAPLTLLFMVLAARRSLATELISFLLLSYLAACCWAACIPSSADMSIAFSQPLSWLFALPALALSAWLTVFLSFKLLRFRHATIDNARRS